MHRNGYWTAGDMPDMSGKTVIVTGANSGIGFETARQLAGKGAVTIMACRSQQKGETALAQIKGEYPQAQLELMLLDLADLASVRAFSSQFQAAHKRLDILCNNAGVMISSQPQTADGIELMFGTNHLGHFALTGLLLPLLLGTPGARVVTVSSGLHRAGKAEFDQVAGGNGSSGRGMKAYGRSKLANLMFSYELQRRLEFSHAGAISVAAHPGWTQTNLQAESKLTTWMSSLMGQSAEMGALPTLYAATAADVQGGDYYGPRGLAESRGYPRRVTSNTLSHDRAAAARLWQVSEELTGISFDGLANGSN